MTEKLFYRFTEIGLSTNETRTTKEAGGMVWANNGR